MNLIPYLNFEGNCEDALNVYGKILNGKVEIVKRYDNPAMQTPDYYKNKVLHAKFMFSDNQVYASDISPVQNLNKGINVAMSLAFTNLGQSKQVFTQLSEGGK